MPAEGENRSPGFAPPLAAFLATGTLLTFVHLRIDPPILLLERFVPGSGFLEVGLLSLYAAWITHTYLKARSTARLRARIWLLFSAVFFLQFGLGLAGVEQCLMTGRLHLPIPALILAGPLFRGGGFFMPILFVSTVLLAGAAWCSHLCYIGSWDNALARSSRVRDNPSWWKAARGAILAGMILTPLAFRWAGLEGGTTVAMSLGYGLTGVAVMFAFSSRRGTMVHCTVYCPIGLLANWIGRLNPFRIRFDSACDGCGACRLACRTNALTESDVQRRKPGISCTLCGDCLDSCSKNALGYAFFRMSPERSRAVFVVAVMILHAVFLGVARI
jgi:polyferredoxin